MTRDNQCLVMINVNIGASVDPGCTEGKKRIQKCENVQFIKDSTGKMGISLILFKRYLRDTKRKIR